MRVNTCRGSEAVPVTYGKQSLDTSHTPVSADQIPASPVLLFKAPAGTVFLADVQISIPVDRSIMDLVNATGTSGEEHKRKLLQTTSTSQRLMQHWFDSSTKVGKQLFVLAFLPGLMCVASTLAKAARDCLLASCVNSICGNTLNDDSALWTFLSLVMCAVSHVCA